MHRWLRTASPTTSRTRLTSDGSSGIPREHTPPTGCRQECGRAIAADVSEQQLGVWATGDSENFELLNHDSLGPPDGELVLPKLFRRCTY